METFKSPCVKIISRMMKQGRTKSRIKQCLRRIYGRNFEIFRSFSPTSFDLCVILFVRLIMNFTNWNVSFWPGTFKEYPFFLIILTGSKVQGVEW